LALVPRLAFRRRLSEKSRQTNRYHVRSVGGLFSFDRRTMTVSGPLKTLTGLAIIMIVQLCATSAALPLALFRYEDEAQRHCRTDSVVGLDFKKGKYYLSGQRFYSHGFHGSYVCLQEARGSRYRARYWGGVNAIAWRRGEFF
jgi:hypothetical protein